MPEIVFIAEVLVCQAEVIPTPGAMMSTQLPILLKDAIKSLLPLAATVTAPGTLAGDELHAFAALFPAATITVTPSLIKLLIAKYAPMSIEMQKEVISDQGVINNLKI